MFNNLRQVTAASMQAALLPNRDLFTENLSHVDKSAQALIQQSLILSLQTYLKEDSYVLYDPHFLGEEDSQYKGVPCQAAMLDKSSQAWVVGRNYKFSATVRITVGVDSSPKIFMHKVAVYETPSHRIVRLTKCANLYPDSLYFIKVKG